jgi:hypothetical protein
MSENKSNITADPNGVSKVADFIRDSFISPMNKRIEKRAQDNKEAAAKAEANANLSSAQQGGGGGANHSLGELLKISGSEDRKMVAAKGREKRKNMSHMATEMGNIPAAPGKKMKVKVGKMKATFVRDASPKPSSVAPVTPAKSTTAKKPAAKKPAAPAAKTPATTPTAKKPTSTSTTKKPAVAKKPSASTVTATAKSSVKSTAPRPKGK